MSSDYEQKDNNASIHRPPPLLKSTRADISCAKDGTVNVESQSEIRKDNMDRDEQRVPGKGEDSDFS